MRQIRTFFRLLVAPRRSEAPLPVSDELAQDREMKRSRRFSRSKISAPTHT